MNSRQTTETAGHVQTLFFACYQSGAEPRILLAAFPGHSQTLSRSCRENSGSGLGTRLKYYQRWHWNQLVCVLVIVITGTTTWTRTP